MGFPFHFYIDVSGQPKGEVHIGLISINESDTTQLLKDAKRKYPKFMRDRQKAAKARPEHLTSIIAYLNGRGVRMVSLRLKAANWRELLDFIGTNKQFKFEMIFAALYFCALKKYSHYGKNYSLTVCIESFMNIDKVMGYLKVISKANGIDYQISKSQARYTEMLKFADYVAAAGRKARPSNYEFFSLETLQMDEIKFYLNKLK